ncbi:hypothetical protein BT69DRAFT_1216951, partial [Atractiella rhizophila]
PNFKLQYFKSQKWPDEWIEEVEHLTMEYLEKNYPDAVRVWKTLNKNKKKSVRVLISY